MKNKNEPKFKLRTVSDLVAAHEWLFQQQRDGKIDAKSADALNTTLKGSVYLTAKLRLEAAKLLLMSHIKKMEVPSDLLPELLGSAHAQLTKTA